MLQLWNFLPVFVLSGMCLFIFYFGEKGQRSTCLGVFCEVVCLVIFYCCFLVLDIFFSIHNPNYFLSRGRSKIFGGGGGGEEEEEEEGGGMKHFTTSSVSTFCSSV